MYPDELLYSKDHEWVRRDGDTCRMGITEFAQDELGDVVFVELPEVGSSFDAEAELGAIESVKAVAEVYAPVGGEVVAVNEALVESPELVNQDPYGKGWLVELRSDDATALAGLMDAAAYRELLDSGG